MRSEASAELIAFLADPANRHAPRCDLWTIVLTDGTANYWTNADVAITAVSRIDNREHTYQPSRIKRGQLRAAVGLEVDGLEVTFYGQPDAIPTAPPPVIPSGDSPPTDLAFTMGA